MSVFLKQIPKLGPEDIEVKVKQVSKKGAVALLYKTARTDMRILDECVGAENWQDEYQEIKGNLYCTIKIYNPDTSVWVGKTDCGTESREDQDGNQKKGEASDAFKRAGFKWGIGRELYTAPFIFLNVETEQNSQTGRYELKNKYARFLVKNIDYSENGSIQKVVIVDDLGNQVFPRTKVPGNQNAPKIPAPDNVIPASDLLVDANHIRTMAAELDRTGKDVAYLLQRINEKFGVSITQIEQVTIKQFRWIMSLMTAAPAKKQTA